MIQVTITTVLNGSGKTKEIFEFSKDSECEKFLKDFQEKRLQEACRLAKQEYKKTLLTGLYPNDNSSLWFSKTSMTSRYTPTLWVNNKRKYEDLRKKVSKHIQNSVKIQIKVI